MNQSKINLLLLPLLVSILLSTASKLKIGNSVNSLFYTLLYPIHQPVGLLRQQTDKQISFVKNLPKLQEENKYLKSQYVSLLSENEQFKQSLGDSKTLSLPSNFRSVLPVRISGAIGNNTVSSTLSLENVKIGQPLISGKILLGTVAEITGSVIKINPLDTDRSGSFSIHTTSGVKGQYRYSDNLPQVINLPNLSPVSSNDYIFTEPAEYIPANLVLGKVKKIISSPQEPLQKAEIILESTLADNPENLFILLQP